MNPTPGVDPVSLQSFIIEQIVDVDSPKSPDDLLSFFPQLSCLMRLIPLFFDWMVILKSSALNALMEETRHREFLLVFLALIYWVCSRFKKLLFMAFFVHCVLQCVGKSLYGAASRAAGVQRRRWIPFWQKGSLTEQLCIGINHFWT